MPRLNFCAGAGILFSIAAVVLVIFGEITQINDMTVPRHLRIVNIDVSGLGAAVAAASGQNQLASIYAANSTEFTRKPYGSGDGLRTNYQWGLWSMCASSGGLGSKPSYCLNNKFGRRFAPASMILADVPQQYQATVQSVLPQSTFTSEGYLGRYTHVAWYLIFVGAILAGIAMLIGLGAHRFAFLAGALFAILAFLCLAVGLVIYTVLFSRVRSSINNVMINGTPLGIHVSYGNGLWILWGACGAALLATIPYLIACCTGRNSGSGKEEEYY